MSDQVSRFCDSVHEKLESLQARMDSIKLNVGSTWHSVEAKLDEARDKGETTKQAVAEARTNLELWVTEKNGEAKDLIHRLIKNRETQKLAVRAQRTEACAGMAIEIAHASIDDAERMIVEAIVALRDAEAIVTG